MTEFVKDKYKENEKIIKLATFFVLMTLMLGLFIYFGTKDFEADIEPVPDNIHFNNDYPKIDKNNVFVYKKINEIQNILKSGNGLVFFCTAKSEWCHSYAEILNDTAKEAGIKEIAYYDIYTDRMKNNQNYKDLMTILGAYLIRDDENNKKLYLPALFSVKNGSIINYNYDTALGIGNATAINYWTIDKIIDTKEKLYIIYNNLNGNESGY